MPSKPKYRWDETARRFRASSGRFLPAGTVRDAIDKALRTASERIGALADQVRANGISLAQWEQQMRRELKSIHLYSAMAAKGGRAQLTQAELGRIGRVLRDQYEKLRGFADDIQSGEQLLHGGLRSRARMYAKAGRDTYEQTRTRDLLAIGFTEIRSIRRSNESCTGCVEQEAKGFQPVSEFVPLGHRDCLTNCECDIERRNPLTGEVAA
jgi:hypothetical protein